MKPREGSAADLGRALDEARAGGRPRTEEVGVDDAGGRTEEVDLGVFEDADSGGRPRPIGAPLQTAEIDISRDRRITLTSMVSAQIAEQMLATARPPRDPAAPQQRPEQHTRRVGENEEHHTRRVGDSDRQRLSPGSGKIEPADASVAARRQRAAALIDEARAALDEGDLTTAVTAAEGALHESDEAPPPGIIEVIEPARPLLARVFGAYVGPLGGVPVLAPRAAEIARARLGERERALIERIDGTRTLEELFDGSGVGSTDALRIAARLIRAGAVRII
ncbi:MAG TPA: hypothetical protein VHG72_16325 [Polyangia bacterium]|nr:hypothetical protein [Polyangia bacterium]